MAKMELPSHKFPLIKMGLHIAQMVLVFVAWILCITVYKSSADTDGRLGWYFGLCFLTLLPIIYLTMPPRFPRTRKLANPYAMAITDLLFALLWLSAFAAVASWLSADKCGSGCGRSHAVIGLGVIVWLLWILTAIMSIYSLIYYRREGYLPGGSRAPTNAGVIDPDKEHFSTAPGVEEYAPVHNAEVHDEETGYGGGGHQQPQSDPMRFNRAGYGGYAPAGQDEHTEYMGYGGGGAAASGGGGGRAQFPSANYNV